MSKLCRKCGLVKAADEFPANRRLSDGLSSWCRECSNEARRKSYWDKRAYLDTRYAGEHPRSPHIRESAQERRRVVLNAAGEAAAAAGIDAISRPIQFRPPKSVAGRHA